EIARVVAGMWDNLGRVVGEYPHLRKICVFEPGGPVETRGFEHVDRAVGAGRRMIFFSGRIANWEIGMLAGVQYGISVAQIYRAANNPLMGSGGKTVTRKRAPSSRSTRSGSTSQSKRSASTARAWAVIAGRPKNGTGMPSFIFWSASNARCVPRRSAVIAARFGQSTM